MSETWEEYINRYRDGSPERADIARYLEMMGDAQPVNSAYWEAILRGDEDAARLILLHRRIFTFKEDARRDPERWSGFVEYLIGEAKKLEAIVREARTLKI